MRLVKVSVRNYRSFNNEASFDLADSTVLVGPNNGGKTNLLRVLAVGMNLLQNWGTLPRPLHGRNELTRADASLILRRTQLFKNPPRDNSFGFVWVEDYPRDTAYDRNVNPTIIRLAFGLDAGETSQLYGTTGIRSGETLELELAISRGSVSLGTVNPEGGAACNRTRAHELSKFVSQRISYIFVPEAKNGRVSQSLMDDLVRMRFQFSPRFEEYRILAEKLDRLRRESTSELGEEVTKFLQQYSSDVDTIEISTEDSTVAEAVTRLSVRDSSFTSIESKGSGYQSLVTMALLLKLVEEFGGERRAVVVVDQPEAHLDAASSRIVRSLLSRISQMQQVVIATHDPTYVNRESISSNVVVRTDSARPARSADEIRDAMGLDFPVSGI